MKLLLPNSLYSADQALAVAEELHQYGRQLGRPARKSDPSPLSSVAEDLLELLPTAQRHQEEAVEELRSELEQLATTAPVITLVVAAPPPASLKQELTGWLRTNISPRVLVNFHVNPEIAGGVVIRSTNRVYDCSFRSGLMAHQDTFTKVLERV